MKVVVQTRYGSPDVLQVREVADHRYSLDDVPEAHRYIDQGHKRGNVVVTP